MKKTFIAIASILAIVAGCAKNNIENGVADGKIRATIESADTKATLNYGGSTSDNYLVWETGDKILLMNADSRVEATLTSGEGTIYGVFEAESVPTGTYYAVYPATAGNRFVSVEGDDSLFVEYPVKLTYNSETGNVENGGNIMIAQQSGSAIKFRNFCSYLHFTITGEETQKVSKIVLEARGEGYLAGQLLINDLESDDFDYDNKDLASKTVDITFTDGEALSETGLSFNVALAPKCEYGFKATVYLTDGSYQELVSNETWGRNKVIAMPAFAFSGKDVAEIGGTKYKNLAAAVEAANAATSDVTIKMLANASSTDSLFIENNNAIITLDLNGKTVDSKFAVKNSFEVKSSAEGGLLTYSGPFKYGCPILVMEGASFTMTSGTIEGVGTTDYDSAIRARGLEGNDATVTINGGTLNANTAYGTVYGYRSQITSQNVTITGRRCFFVTTSSNLTVNSGTYSSESSTSLNSCIHSGATSVVIVLNDGTFSAGKTFFTYYNNNSSNGDVTIVGGKYSWAEGENFAPTTSANLKPQGGVYTQDISSYIQGQYACVANTDPVYKYKVEVSLDNSILQVGDEKYETVADAMAAVNSATSPVTIKLLKNITFTTDFRDSLVFTNSVTDVTLDLNDRVLMSTTGDAPVVTTAKNLTIQSPTNDGAINQATSATANALRVSGGICNITSGTITHSAGIGYYLRTAIMASGDEASATVNISGGVITAGGRVISFGSDVENRKVYVNISGGLIKARTTGKENSGKTISYVNSADFSMVRSRKAYGYLTITGGTFYAYYQPILYLNFANTSITVKRDGESVPYFYQNNPDWTGTAGGKAQTGTIFKAYSSTTAALFSVQECYTNAVNVSHAAILTTYGATAHEVSPVVTDSYGNSYDNHFVKDEE